jgi:hypothetical protein
MAYNLDIREYNLEDLFHLFEIPCTVEIRPEHIRLAKQKVIMSHPDKSKLPPEYFIFYNVPTVSSKETEMVYEPMSQNPNITKSDFSRNIETKHFNRKFNELFEKNEMIGKPNSKKNEWFQQQENPFEQYQTQTVKNTNQMNETLERIKTQEKERALALYRGVVPLSLSNNGKNLYDDVEEEDENEYICSDPFSKLKYDDLRKVHKDQTVFMISEKDPVKSYHSVDQYKRERENTIVKPKEKEKAEKRFYEEERRKQETILRKQHTSELKTMENMEKNKSIMASFLRLL